MRSTWRMSGMNTFQLTPAQPILYNLSRGLPMRYTASDTDAKLTTLLEYAQRKPFFMEREWRYSKGS